MTDPIQTQPSMARLLLTYTAVLIFATALSVIGLRLWWSYTGQGFPVLILMYIVPLVATLQAAKQYVKQSGKRASFVYSLIFGILATLVILAMTAAAWKMGWLDGVMEQIDPSAMRNGDRVRPLTTMLVFVGGLGLILNFGMFWAGTYGEAKRIARLAEKEAAKRA